MSPQARLPLAGVKVVEFAGLAPGPMAGMILADWGADIIRVDRPGSTLSVDVLSRGKRSIAIDPKTRSGYAVVQKLVEQADVLIEPFRPGVMERLKLGPEVFLGEEATGHRGTNERLIYARLVGFPRSGPYKDMAGHDLNYLAISGVLSMLPGEGKPEAPLNLLADFAGGALMCAMGIMLALIDRNKSGLGQVVNTDMVTGVRYLSSFPFLVMHLNTPFLGEKRGAGIIDGGAPFYNVYSCADGQWMSVACIEPQFFRLFLQRFLGALPDIFALEDGWRPSEDSQNDKGAWPRMKNFFERGFKLYPRDHWTKIFHETDACTVPVLSVQEAAVLASNASHGTSVPSRHPDLTRQSASLPTQGTLSSLSNVYALPSGTHTEDILSELGIGAEERAVLRREGALGSPLDSKL